MSPIKIIITDDHQLFRKGLEFILGEYPDVEIIGQASNGKELLDLLEYATPDVILLDINMPVMDGLAAAAALQNQKTPYKILVLTMFDEDEQYNQMIELGAKGFILKDADNNELIQAIRKVAGGGNYYSQDLLLNLLRKKPDANEIEISEREREVLELICKGFSNMQISDTLHISQRTVERHRANLLAKTNSANSVSLVIYAIRKGIVKI